MNEEALIEGCLKHDSASQQKVYEEYFNSMAHVANRYAKNQDDAKEILLDGFKNFFNHFSEFSEVRAKKSKAGFPLSIQDWLKKKMIESAISHMHENKKEYFVSSTVSVRDEKKKTEELTEAQLVERISTPILIQALEKLTPSYRAVFNLHEIDNHSHQEISILLDISEYASRDMLEKAKFNLKKNIIELLSSS